tara:strand:- start:740 stop:1117 length:378 start_codon:yes stop_codon:yes gene_type:complete
MSILTAFNNHFEEFLNDVVRVFPDDMEIATAANALGKLRKANPRLIILTFKDHVRKPYGAQIEEGNLEFFLEKDYTSDVEGSSQAGAILDKVDKIKEPIRNMDETEKAKVLQYLQNLCKICDLYN